MGAMTTRVPPQRTTDIRKAIENTELQQSLDHCLVRAYDDLRHALREWSQQQSEQADLPADLLAVFAATASREAAADLLAWNAALARNAGFTNAAIAEAMGMRATSIPRQNLPLMPAIEAADNEAWENRHNPDYRPQPVQGRRLRITVDTYRLESSTN